MTRRKSYGAVLLSGLLMAGFSGAATAQEAEDELVVLCTPQEQWCVKMVEESASLAELK